MAAQVQCAVAAVVHAMLATTFFCFSFGLHLPGGRELMLHSISRAFVGYRFASCVRLSN